MMKPPRSHLRLLNHIVSGYIDDLYLQDSTYQRCTINVIDPMKIIGYLISSFPGVKYGAL